METTVNVPAFHGNAATKQMYVDRMNDHAKNDEIVQGETWDRGKGCFIGCSLHHYDHEMFAHRIGGNEQLARLLDAIFEGLTNEAAKQFAVDVFPAIPVGADLSMVASKFALWLLESPDVDLAGKAFDDGKSAIAVVADLYRRRIEGAEPLASEWSAVRSAARSAARSARSVRSAARSAESAAESAAWSAESAAWSAVRSAAWSAAWSAWSAESAAWSAARSAALSDSWGLMAKRILEMLSEAKA